MFCLASGSSGHFPFISLKKNDNGNGVTGAVSGAGVRMKKLFILIALALGIYFWPQQSKAQTSAPLVISGTVALINTAVINPLPESQALNILDGEINRLVATVVETSNNPKGYRILVSSANGSRLVHTTQPRATVPYTLSYGGAPAVTLQKFNQELKRVPSVDGLVTNTSEVRVTLDKLPQALVGTYNDTVSISISAD